MVRAFRMFHCLLAAVVAVLGNSSRVIPRIIPPAQRTQARPTSGHVVLPAQGTHVKCRGGSLVKPAGSDCSDATLAGHLSGHLPVDGVGRAAWAAERPESEAAVFAGSSTLTSAQGQRGRVAMGVFGWLRKKLGLKKKSPVSPVSAPEKETAPATSPVSAPDQEAAPAVSLVGGRWRFALAPSPAPEKETEPAVSPVSAPEQEAAPAVSLVGGRWRFAVSPAIASEKTEEPAVSPVSAPEEKKELVDESVRIEEVAGGDSTFVALLVAASNGHAENIRRLVESGADPNKQDAFGWTPLRYAVRKGNTDAAIALIESGADVDLASKSGRTPLMSAAYNGYPDIIKLLLKAGADHTKKNNVGETAFRISMRGGVLGCAECRVALTIS